MIMICSGRDYTILFYYFHIPYYSIVSMINQSNAIYDVFIWWMVKVDHHQYLPVSFPSFEAWWSWTTWRPSPAAWRGPGAAAPARRPCRRRCPAWASARRASSRRRRGEAKDPRAARARAVMGGEMWRVGGEDEMESGWFCWWTGGYWWWTGGFWWLTVIDCGWSWVCVKP